jgi:hypothetical protein
MRKMRHWVRVEEGYEHMIERSTDLHCMKTIDDRLQMQDLHLPLPPCMAVVAASDLLRKLAC